MIKVLSKIELSKELKTSIESILKEKYSSKAEEIVYEIDTSIIAGIKIDINSEIIDLTINNRIQKILESLK